MKKAFVAAFAALAFTSFAKTYYVDPTENGSNDYDGEAEVWDGTHGPMHTLQAVMGKAKSSGDVVIALPGVYNEGSMNQRTYGSNRVVVASGVLLKSRDGAATTTIEGRVSEQGTNGFGPDSLRCVYLNPGAVLCGFTLTKGRSSTLVSGTNIQVGGGVCGGNGANAGYCVDCVFSSNTASQGGRHVFGSRLLRCYLGSVATGGSNYSCYMGTVLVDCVHDTTGYPYNNIQIYNTTFLSGYVSASKASYPAYVYNSVFLGSSANHHTHFYNCRSVAALVTANSFDEGGNEFSVAAANLQYDAETYRPKVGSHALDTGDTAYYALATNGWSALAQSFVGTDFAGGRRVYNGAIDIGAGEHNPCAEFSAILSAQGAVTVTDATSGVTGAVDCVSIGAGEMVWSTLNKNGEAAKTSWGFYAQVNGTGVLKVYFGDSADPVAVTSADGQKAIGYAAADATALRIVYEGDDGAAEISRFVNQTEVTIAADSAGVDISGDITGTGSAVVPAGTTLTFTIARTNETTRFVSGLEVNGEFINLYDYPNGKTFVVSGDDVFSGVTVNVVYADTREWFVDADKGDDGNCGLYTNMAFKTLSFAASVATASGDTITALPGVYNEGGKGNTTYGSNRVEVAAGVLLRSAFGAAVTTIEGKPSANSGASYGCGADSMRAVYLKSGAVLSGFTVTKGRSSSSPSTTLNRCGGGIYGGLCVDCVFTNNASPYRGNTASSTTLLRCRLDNNPTGGSYQGYLSINLIDCVVNDAKRIEYTCKGYNTTFLKGYLYGHEATGSSRCSAWNCVFYGNNPPQNCDLYNTLTVPNIGSGDVDKDDNCQFGLKASEIPYDAETCRPKKGSLAIDSSVAAGYYALATNGWSKLWQSFVGADYAGGQRVYNGAIDIGAGEYDWRGDFAKCLAKKGVAVETASAGVTTNMVAGLDLADGETLTIKCMPKTDGKASFKVVTAGEGSATVVVGDTQLVPVENVYSFDVIKGENNVKVSFAGEGKATVSDFALPKLGVIVVVR